MSESKPHTVTFRGRINKEEAQEVSVSSLDQSFPAIYQIGSSIDDIQNYVMKDREVNIYPRNSSTDSIKAILYERITEISKRGLACVFDNFSVCANIKTTMKPDEVLFDLCMIIKDFPPFILTVAQPEHVNTKSVVRYNLSLARKVIGGVRSFTDEPFSALYGVITHAHLKDEESFLQALKDIEKVKSASFVPLSLELPDTKRQQIILALLSSVALTTSVDDEDDLLWFLTLEQFVILTENIDKREVIVRTTPSSGGKVLMREIARRLERSGHTLLVMESKEQIEVARKQKTCSFMLTLEEWKTAKETDLEGLTNMVTNCQDCPPPPGITGKSWTFVPGAQHEMDRERVNVICHVTEDGRLVNTESNIHTQQGSRRFKKYCGTCSTSPIHLPPSPSSLTPAPPGPQYWEAESAVGMKGKNMKVWPVIEIGVVEVDSMDSYRRVDDRPRSSWCVRVGRCDTHIGYCTQIWNQEKLANCVRDSMSDTPGTYTLKYGVVVDVVRGRVGFVDVDKGVVLGKMDAEFTQTIYPVFGVWPYSEVTVEMRLITGSDVTMTEDKQKLIYSCLK